MEVAPRDWGMPACQAHSRTLGSEALAVSWLHSLPLAEGVKYLTMTAASPVSPLSQQGLLD